MVRSPRVTQSSGAAGVTPPPLESLSRAQRETIACVGCQGGPELTTHVHMRQGPNNFAPAFPFLHQPYCHDPDAWTPTGAADFTPPDEVGDASDEAAESDVPIADSDPHRSGPPSPGSAALTDGEAGLDEDAFGLSLTLSDHVLRQIVKGSDTAHLLPSSESWSGSDDAPYSFSSDDLDGHVCRPRSGPWAAFGERWGGRASSARGLCWCAMNTGPSNALIAIRPGERMRRKSCGGGAECCLTSQRPLWGGGGRRMGSKSSQTTPATTSTTPNTPTIGRC